MVILIGAESCTGKTLMAQRLLEAHKIPYLSADHLKMGLYRANPDCGFTPTDSNEAIEKHLWPILKGIIETNIENHQSLIIEGCYIFPQRLSEFEEKYREKIIPVFMGFSRAYIRKNYASGIIAHKGAIEMREGTDDREMDWFIGANEKMKALCEQSAIPYFEIHDQYNEDVKKIHQWIAIQIGEQQRQFPRD